MSISGPDSGDGGPKSIPRGASPDSDRPTLPCERNELPWVDQAILDDLEQQMGSRAIAWRFARDYAQMWLQRQRALMTAAERQDHRGALDAALSLKNSSAMVGGLRLARLAETLETVIRSGQGPDSWRDLLDAVAHQGQSTVSELEHGYLKDGPTGTRALDR
jgi:HPt (histidine-containing phosphotransfer) domain-containing protein